MKCLTLFVFLFVSSSFSLTLKEDYEAKLNMTQLVHYHGYGIEEHQVNTQDGYILTLFRIVGERPANRSEPILFQHGIVCTSVDWVIMGPNSSLGIQSYHGVSEIGCQTSVVISINIWCDKHRTHLWITEAYMAVDAGFDVWISNSRGNYYSREHVSLSPDSKEFWNFSFHQLGVYDLPAIVDFILEQTKRQQLHFVGHSQGTTDFLVFASERQEYSNKIKLATLLAPVAFLTHYGPPGLFILADLVATRHGTKWILGTREVFALGSPSQRIIHDVCKNPKIDFICVISMYIAFGFNPKELNSTTFDKIFAHYPAGSSSLQFLHFIQLVQSPGHFRKFNYKIEENQKLYGSKEPPEYNLNSTIPLSIFHGKNDELANVKDVQFLLNKLPKSSLIHVKEDPKFNHVDFLYGMHAKERIYREALSIIQNFH